MRHLRASISRRRVYLLHQTAIRSISSSVSSSVPSDQLDDDTAAAISEVRQTKDGAISIKMHAKEPNLKALEDHYGITRPERIEGKIEVAPVINLIGRPAD